MLGPRRPSLLFLLLAFQAAAAGAPREESGSVRLNGIWGESVTFSPVVPTGTRVTNIVWNAKTIIAVVEPGKQAPLNVIDQRYAERLRVPDGGYSLQITGLSQEDTGTYTAQITIQGITEPIFQRFALHVYKRLTESDITIFPVQDSVRTVNGTCNVTLHCTLQGGGEDVTYTWNQTSESTVVSSEASIFILHRLGCGVLPVTCTARNPVSSSSKSISLQEFCEGFASSPASYCQVKGILLLVVLGTLVTAIVMVHVLTRDKERLDYCKEMEVAAIAEESVQLQPVKLPESWAEITWKVTLDSAETYRIIDPVKKSDSGLYTLLIDTGGGREDITKFRVSVFERVRQPNLTVLSAHAELGQCNVTLSCSVPGADRVTYGWSRGTSRIPSDRDHQLHGHQSLLHVVINANSSDAFYRCNASNQASWGADTVDGKSLCDSPATGFASSPASYCQVKGILLLVVLGALVTAIVMVQVLTRDKESASYHKGKSVSLGKLQSCGAGHFSAAPRHHQGSATQQTLPANPLRFWVCSVRTPVIWTDGRPLCLPLAVRMEGARRPSLLMLLLVLQPGGFGRAEADALELSGILGGSVTFPLEIPAAEQFEIAAWTVNTNSLATVTPGKPPNVVLIDKTNYRGRLEILDQSYSLQLTRLRMEDTGQYRAAVNTDKGSVTKRFTLRVYKPVPEPTVLCDSVTCVSETCNYNLSCTVRDGGEHVTYSWTHTAGGAVVPNESILHISLSPRDAHLNVTCTAQNPASNSSTTASAKNLCAAHSSAPASSLSYCHVKGIVLLLVLGALSAGIIVVHVHPGRERRRD
ncbi:T-lymphocyte surface antigen Ly-9-like [Malaclemys terrapin pileata]|uniref:T-lymphocyte surface antigen Ly-9-like n=1 Tax=Malaclemys terrapin pileata TaxID=2991368 RepID=UPI0023A7A8DB|nr:T-lymphocyte surface antigen Ly-9-like [Malaclemys terrapin pileata]